MAMPSPRGSEFWFILALAVLFGMLGFVLFGAAFTDASFLVQSGWNLACVGVVLILGRSLFRSRVVLAWPIWFALGGLLVAARWPLFGEEVTVFNLAFFGAVLVAGDVLFRFRHNSHEEEESP